MVFKILRTDTGAMESSHSSTKKYYLRFSILYNSTPTHTIVQMTYFTRIHTHHTYILKNETHHASGDRKQDSSLKHACLSILHFEDQAENRNKKKIWDNMKAISGSVFISSLPDRKVFPYYFPDASLLLRDWDTSATLSIHPLPILLEFLGFSCFPPTVAALAWQNGSTPLGLPTLFPRMALDVHGSGNFLGFLGQSLI